MRRASLLALVVAALALPAGPVAAAAAPPPEEMVQVGPGVYRPPFRLEGEPAAVEMDAFLLDRTPVTVEAFRRFLVAHPEWRRDRASRLLVDDGYLSDWAGPLEPGPDLDPRAPVTRVSWFAARAYCEARGARLPTAAEWEMAAAADATRPDATGDPAFTQRILAWYATRTPPRLPPVGQGEPNHWGAHDLHGLVWEWVLDFNSALVTGDSREDGAADGSRFCGGAALSARDAADYASFMRWAFRGSLQARFTTRNLGFRCARDAGGER